MKRLEFDVPGRGCLAVDIDIVLLGAFTGRELADVQAHIDEMAVRGVTPPADFPLFYRAMTCLLTQGGDVEASGCDTCPEVEFVIFSVGGEQFVTVGNDQFDLDLEARGFGEKSKNICQKVVARTAWPLGEVSAHWDRLILELAQEGRPLQRGPVSQLGSPARLSEKAACVTTIPRDGTMFFSGTIPFMAEIGSGTRTFSAALIDPVLRREIRHDFRISVVTAAAAA